MNDPREIGDLAAGITAAASLLSWLPEIAAGLSILWYLFRFVSWVVKR